MRVTIKFRGREMDYPEIALEDLREIAQSLSDVSVIEQAPMMEGRTMLVVLVPAKAAQEEGKGAKPGEASYSPRIVQSRGSTSQPAVIFSELI